jgi:glycosyl transferase family 87
MPWAFPHRPLGDRGARALAAAAFLIGLVAGFAVLRTFGFLDIWESGIFGSDFSLIWAGGYAFVSGSNPYDPATWQRVVSDLRVQPTSTAVFIYPGWVPLFLAPFGLLRLTSAAPLWLGVTLVAGAVGLFALLEDRARNLPLAHTIFGFLLVASEPGIVTFYSGQWDFLLVGALALMALWMRRQPALAGAVAGAMLFKPQLFLVGLPALVRVAAARRNWRFIGALAAVGTVAAIASAVAFPGWWSAYMTVPATQAGDMRAATLPNALGDALGPAGLVIGAVVVFAVVVLAFAYSPRAEAALPVWLAVSLLAVPYEFVYDHLVSLVPLALTVGILADRRPRLALFVAAAAFGALVVAGIVLHAVPGVARGNLSFNGFVQFGMSALVMAALWPYRRVPAV